MHSDSRSDSARYYDLNPNLPNDLPFYKRLISSKELRVLELGCGTGRILIPLSSECAYIHGIDRSESMIDICKHKLESLGISHGKAEVQVGNIAQFHLHQKFDLIIAPFRVLQNLEFDDDVVGLFESIKIHLAALGSCVLNAFRPYAEPETIRRDWVSKTEQVEWQVTYEDGKLVCSSMRTRIDKERLVVYPEMIYRKFKGSEVVDEARMSIAMRCYYPDELISLIQRAGFHIIRKWGGYQNQEYGSGPELVVQFERGG
jgi:SAM-dependent methyltransferase